MLTKIISVLIAGIVAVGLWAAPQAAAYSPRDSVKFNRPIGRPAAREALSSHINRAIASTRRGDTIRIALYSFDRSETATQLVRAHRRGVNVRIVIDYHLLSQPILKLRRELGTKLSHRSFVRFCARGCRGQKMPMHLKFFLFSRAGASRHVVMVGSGNITAAAAKVQWNDLVTEVGRPKLYRQYVRVFNQAARKIRVRNPYVKLVASRFQSEFFPRADLSLRTDPILVPLGNVRCKGARNTRNRRTRVWITMSTWRGDRGVAIANRLVQMANHGCRIKVLYGQSSPRVTGLLRWRDRRGRISVRGTAFDRDFDGEADLFAHAKYMTVRGRWKDDRTAWVTWTGSSNWSDGGLRGDELVFRIKGKATHRRYVRNFSDISRSGSYYSSRYAFDLARGARSPSVREPTFHDD